MKVLESSSEISLQVLALKMLVHPKYSFFDYFFRQGHFYPFIQTLSNKRFFLNHLKRFLEDNLLRSPLYMSSSLSSNGSTFICLVMVRHFEFDSIASAAWAQYLNCYDKSSLKNTNLIKWDASSRWSFRPISTWSCIETAPSGRRRVLDAPHFSSFLSMEGFWTCTYFVLVTALMTAFSFCWRTNSICCRISFIFLNKIFTF